MVIANEAGAAPMPRLEADEAAVDACMARIQQQMPVRQSIFGLSIEVPSQKAELLIRRNYRSKPARTIRMVLGRQVFNALGMRTMAFAQNTEGRGFNPMELMREIGDCYSREVARDLTPAVYLLLHAAAKNSAKLGFNGAEYRNDLMQFAQMPVKEHGFGLTAAAAGFLANKVMREPLPTAARPAFVTGSFKIERKLSGQ